MNFSSIICIDKARHVLFMTKLFLDSELTSCHFGIGINKTKCCFVFPVLSVH